MASLEAVTPSALTQTHPRPQPLGGSRREARKEAILRAVLEEVAEVGYSALSVEDVATRIGIAKTTIYRRYPTKLELVSAAIRQYLDEAIGEPPDTGTLRGDLIAIGLNTVQLATSVLGQSLVRTKMLGRSEPELQQLGMQFEAERRQQQHVIAQRAVARGELASAADYERVANLLSGALLFSVVFNRQSIDELEITRTVDLLLHGVSPAATRHRTAPR